VANPDGIIEAVVPTTTFPSPCGVNIVANIKTPIGITLDDLVSVPLRGKYRGKFQC